MGHFLITLGGLQSSPISMVTYIVWLTFIKKNCGHTVACCDPTAVFELPYRMTTKDPPKQIVMLDLAS